VDRRAGRGGPTRAQRGVRQALGVPAPGPRGLQQFGIGHKDARRDWCFVVLDPSSEEEGHPAVAAYTLSSAYTQDWRAQGYTQGWTGLLGVRPDWRGRGLAPALLAAALRAFAADGMHKAGLDVDTGNASGALRLYEGMGYRVEHTSITWAIEGKGSAAP